MRFVTIENQNPKEKPSLQGDSDDQPGEAHELGSLGCRNDGGLETRIHTPPTASTGKNQPIRRKSPQICRSRRKIREKSARH
jgi:hypothetical protein